MTIPKKTKAIASLKPGAVDAADGFVEVDVDVPELEPHDVLVEVRAVSVNPVDTNIRKSFKPEGAPKVLGFDAAGVVVAVGKDVRAFKAGDEVFYAGSIARAGTNTQLHRVDERIVGRKPSSLSFTEAAALPLTTLTAWETLFDQLRLGRESRGTLLVLSGAGGVGSMIIQLARKLTSLEVIATASRPDSAQWAKELGAQKIANHHNLVPEVSALAPNGVDYIFSPHSTGNVEAYAKLMKPRGEVVAIDSPEHLDTLPLKSKSQTWHWESMFSRSLHEPESTYQSEALNEAARLIDAGTLRTTLTAKLSPINAENLREAHRRVESSSMIGKIVVTNDTR